MPTRTKKVELTSDEFYELMGKRFAAAAEVVADLHEAGFTRVSVASLSHSINEEPIVYVTIDIENGMPHEKLMWIVNYGSEMKVQLTDRIGERGSITLWPGKL